MIKYDLRWGRMKAKNITQYKLIKEHGFSAGQLSRLRANAHISSHTIDVLCSILDCKVEDVMTYHPDA